MASEQATVSANHSKLPVREAEVEQYIDRFLDTVCDTRRRAIVELLAISSIEEETPILEMRSGDIARAIGLSAATTSEHLRQLAQTGLLTSRRQGNTVYYSLCNHKLVQAFRDLLEALDTDYRNAGPQS
ncbi:ArsR/SmtB family transcription factor [Ktedonobacter racemifer]|uniref:Transcriptional regulator, ArsR family n=1 Tax=Ktedonobacter racemifer DSM 44963 TaxID=485913 RepID=D6TP25_KTERA|nr:metalloregulator ArsR/SmtB family transcription factor [Ktedonobacter racemifer]EFH87381.1 transcriptional regulator, ArsR family [Ktedonobacter racemifer DSM 44963]